MAVPRRVGWAYTLGGEGSRNKQAVLSYTLPSLWALGNAAVLVSNWFTETPQARQ